MPKDLTTAFDIWYKSLYLADGKDWHVSETWNLDLVFKKAQTATPGLEITVAETHDFMQRKIDDPLVGQERSHLLNLFISAAYAHCKEEVIVFDIKLAKPATYLAYKLPADKVFVVQTEMGRSIGCHAQGLLINYSDIPGWKCEFAYGAKDVLNYGTLGNEAACETKGLVANLGTAGNKFAHCLAGIAFNLKQVGSNFAECNSGIAIQAGVAGDSVGFCGEGHIFEPKETQYYEVDDAWKPKVYSPDECARMPQLGEYIAGLKSKLELGRNDISAAVEVMKSLSQAKIAADLQQIVSAAGLVW